MCYTMNGKYYAHSLHQFINDLKKKRTAVGQEGSALKLMDNGRVRFNGEI